MFFNEGWKIISPPNQLIKHKGGKYFLPQNNNIVFVPRLFEREKKERKIDRERDIDRDGERDRVKKKEI